MRVLIITKIFPNACDPTSSPFNRQQFSALARTSDVEVLATIPWFPGARFFRGLSSAGRLVDVPASELIDGLRVRHPRFLYVPKVGRTLSGALYAASLAAESWRRRGRVDVVLGAWAYPDGWAAIEIARMLDVPAVVKLHGSDMNVVASMKGPRALLRRALPRAARVVAVSRALAQQAVELGVPADRVDVVPNGIDTALFFPRPRAAARAELAVAPTDRLVLYVGNLQRAKGVGDLLAAFELVASKDSRARLCIVGDGPLRRTCQRFGQRHSCRVRVVGTQPMREVPRWLAACDVLALPSWSEGTPNVLLEARACGRRVVATRVGGIPDIVSETVAGELVPPRDPVVLSRALRRALSTAYDPVAVASSGSAHDWTRSAHLLQNTLARAVDVHARASAGYPCSV
jgi:glycosyltransferase involved in cell wall biosynthesis